MHHGLFIAAKIIFKAFVLFESLADSGNIAVAEDSKNSRDESELFAIASGKLILKIVIDCLRFRQTSFY